METGTGGVQSVLLLGGTSEIGMATVRALVDRGARRVLLAGRSPDDVASSAAAIREAGAEVEVLTFDACDTSSHEPFANKALANGDVDLVLFAFGVLGDQIRAESDPAHALEIAETNYVGTLSTALHLLRGLGAQGHGILIFLSSVAGERARRSNFVYGSSKAGLDAFAQGLSAAVEGTGLRVIIVRPGFVKTKMTSHLKPSPLSTTAEEVAKGIVDALERGADTIWVPPLMRWIMSVMRHLPRSLFRRLPV